MSRSATGEAGQARRVVDIAGTVGYSARALVFAVIGVFLIRAAWEHDPSETIGLDGALLRLAQAPLGPLLLALVGAGFGCYAVWAAAGPLPLDLSVTLAAVEAAASPQTLPWSWYVDPAVLATEQERVFRRHWQYVARRDQLDEPGRYVAARAGDVPVLLVRGREGAARLPQCLPAPRLARLRGRGPPRDAAVPVPRLDVRPRRVASLRPALGARAGLRHRRPRPRAARRRHVVDHSSSSTPIRTPALQEVLGPLPDLLAAGGIDVESLRFLRRDEGEYAANWKICCENYLECYHCQVAHPGFSRWSTSPRMRTGSRRRWPPASTARSEAAGGGFDPSGDVEPVPLPLPEHDDQRHAGSPEPLDRAVVPLSPERTHRFLDYFVSLDVDEEWIADLLAFDHQVGAEDRVLVERVQRGVRSGLLAGGRLLPESERLVAHFQRLLVDALA